MKSNSSFTRTLLTLRIRRSKARAAFSALLLCFLLCSCTEPTSPSHKHQRRLTSILNDDNLEIGIVYNEWAKVSLLQFNMPDGRRYTKTHEYTSEGQLQETRFGTDNVYKRFNYDDQGSIVGLYTLPSPIDSDPCAGRFIHESIVRTQSVVLAYSITRCLDITAEPIYVVSRQLNNGSNVSSERMSGWSESNDVLWEEILEYDDAINPFFNIDYFDAFDRHNSNRNNVLSKIELVEGKLVCTYLYEYEYEEGYPVRRTERVFDREGVVISEKQEQYFYD